jgi:hypothetical protein
MPAAKATRRTAPQMQFMDASSDSPVSCTPVAATNSSLMLTTQVTIAVHRTPVACPLRLLIPKERSSGGHALLATIAVHEATWTEPRTSAKQSISRAFMSTVAFNPPTEFPADRITCKVQLRCPKRHQDRIVARIPLPCLGSK